MTYHHNFENKTLPGLKHIASQGGEKTKQSKNFNLQGKFQRNGLGTVIDIYRMGVKF